MESPFPPFEPEEDIVPQKTRLRDIPLRTLFPNILTLLAICSGLTAIRFAIELRFELALAAIVLAAFLDGIDGRVARFLKSSSRFGAQMDSLADFVNFGVAPAMILFFSSLHGLNTFGWVSALVFAMCACLRLARFNVELDRPNRPAFQNDFFVGVPAPAAALIVLLPVYLKLLGMGENAVTEFLTACYMIAIGLLMVSSLPTYSGKRLGEYIPRNVALPMILAVVISVAILLSYPWVSLCLIAIGYLLALPWGVSYYKKLETDHVQTMQAKKASAKYRSSTRKTGKPKSTKKK